MAENEMLLTEKTLNDFLRKNIEQSKAEEFDDLDRSKVKLYKTLQLEDETLIDTYGVSETLQNELPKSPEIILDMLRIKNIRGMSGDGFPVTEKLEAFFRTDAQEKYFIINAVECDPALLHDEWLLTHRREGILRGIEAIQRLCPDTRTMLASRRETDFPGVECIRLDYGYPLGEERTLIDRLLGIRLKQSDTVPEKGILVFNLQTVYSIGLALSGVRTKGRYLTVADLTKGTARIARVPYGYSAMHLLEKIYGERTDAQAYAGMGGLNAHKMNPVETIQIDTGLIAYAAPVAFAAPDACTSCEACMKKCPKHLPVPGMIRSWELAEKNRLGSLLQALKYRNANPTDFFASCTFCMACVYYCEEGLDPMGMILKKYGK